METGLPVFVLRQLSLPAWTVGVLFAVNTAMLTVLQLPVSRVLDRHRPGAVLAVGGLSYAGPYAALTLSAGAGQGVQVTLLVCGMAVCTLGEPAVTQAVLVLLTGIPPQSQQGACMAFNQFSIGGSTAAAPCW